MINLEDIGVEMSRISIKMTDIDYQEEKIPANLNSNQSLQYQNQEQPQSNNQQIKMTVPNDQNEWKKPQFLKKKKFGNKVPTKDQSYSKINEMIIQEQDIKVEIKQEIQKKNQAKTNKELYIEAQNKKRKQIKTDCQNIFEDGNFMKQDSPNSPVPLPLFDCIFCAGLHEHLALQTVKEKQIQRKYNIQQKKDAAIINSLQNDSRQNNQTVDLLDYSTLRFIDQLFVINQLESQFKCLLNVSQSQDDSNCKEYNYSLQERLRQNIQQNLISNQNQKYDLIYSKQIKQKQLKEQQIINNNLEIINNTKIAYEKEKLMISNMLENFEEINSEDQSMFINLNIRNRRQKILHDLSFETEVYDIYDPQFSSSQEEDYSNTSTDSMIQSSEYGSQQVDSEEEKSKIDKYKEEGAEQKKSSQLMMNYDSENESSLSSIHKEIAPVTEIDLVQQLGPIIPNKQTHDQVSYGGCKFEEMQDDTVVNKCNQILNFQNISTHNRFEQKQNSQFHSDHKNFRQLYQISKNEPKPVELKQQSQQNQYKEMVDTKFVKNKINIQSDKKQKQKDQILLENKSETSSGQLSEIQFEDNLISHKQYHVEIKKQIKNSLNRQQSNLGGNQKLSYSPLQKTEQERPLRNEEQNNEKVQNEYLKMKNNTNGPIIRKKNQSIGSQIDSREQSKKNDTNMKQKQDYKSQKIEQKQVKTRNDTDFEQKEMKNHQSTSLNDEPDDLPQKPSLINAALTQVASTANLSTLNSVQPDSKMQKKDFNSKLFSKESRMKQSQNQVLKSQKITNDEIKMTDYQRKNMLKSELIMTSKNSVRKVNKLEFLTNNLQKNKELQSEVKEEEETKKLKLKSATPNKVKLQEDIYIEQMKDYNGLNINHKNNQLPNDEYFNQIHKQKLNLNENQANTKKELFQNKVNNQILKKQDILKANIEEITGVKYKQLKKKNITSQSNENLLLIFALNENENLQSDLQGGNAALTKGQIKLMKHLEKQQITKSINLDSKNIPPFIHPSNKQISQDEKSIKKVSNHFDQNLNRKNVMENYFQTGQIGLSNKQFFTDLKINEQELNQEIIVNNDQDEQKIKKKQIIKNKEILIVNTKIEQDKQEIQFNNYKQYKNTEQIQEFQKQIFDKQNSVQNYQTKDNNQKRINSINQQNEQIKNLKNKYKQNVDADQKKNQQSEPQKKMLFPKFEQEEEHKISTKISINRFENQYLPSFYMQSNMNMFSPMISPSIQSNIRFKDSNQKCIIQEPLIQNEDKQKIQYEKQQKIVYQKSMMHQSTSQLEQMSNSNDMNSFSLAQKQNANKIQNSQSTLKLSENNQSQIQKYKQTAQESKLSFVNNQEKQNMEFKSMKKQQPKIDNPKYCKIKITRSRSKEQQSAQSSLINLSENQPFNLESKYIFPQKINFVDNQVKIEKQVSEPQNLKEIKQFQSIAKIQNQQNNQEKQLQKHSLQSNFIMKIGIDQKKSNNQNQIQTKQQIDQNKKQKFLTINNVPPINNFNSLTNQNHQEQDSNKDNEYFKKSQKQNVMNKNIKLPTLKEIDQKYQNNQTEMGHQIESKRETKISKQDSQSVISAMINSQQVGQSTFMNNFAVNATSTTASSHLINNLLSQRDYSHFNQDTDSNINTNFDHKLNSQTKIKRGLAFNYQRKNQDLK